MYKPILIVVIAVILAGCSISPVDYETTPVQVSTSQGIVTCQLYTKEQTLWDRPIKVPAGMSITAGYTVCRNEGIRRKNGT